MSRKAIVEQGELWRRFLYLCGLFRFLIEFIRATPKVIFGLSGFQWAMLGMLVWLLTRDLRAFTRRTLGAKAK